MLEKVELRLVGDDDSGPEDALDDLDLECGSPPLSTVTFRLLVSPTTPASAS
jgi:hypothetical protein